MSGLAFSVAPSFRLSMQGILEAFLQLFLRTLCTAFWAENHDYVDTF